MAYLLLLIRTIVPPHVSIFPPDVCHQKLLEIVHREEVKVNWILSAKVEFLNSEKGPRDRYKLPGYTTYFHTFQKGRLKNGAGAERAWYLIWEAADRCLLKVGHSECWRSTVGRSPKHIKVNVVSK